MNYVQATTESAPWWGVPVIAGLFTVLGITAAQVVTWSLDKRRVRRDDEFRWHVDRRMAYSAFQAAALTFVRDTTRRWNDDEFDLWAARGLLSDTVFRLQEIELIASPDVFSAANKIAEHLYQLAGEFGNPGRSEEVRRGYFERLQQLEPAFVAAARRDLGVPP